MRIAWHLVTVAGGRAIPGRAVTWDPPMGDDVWRSLEAAWRREAGPFDGLAVYERTQPSRTGFAALLLNDGTPTAFVKVRCGDERSLKNEYAALDALERRRPASFIVPKAVSNGTVDTWHYLLATALQPNLHHAPVNPPLEAILDEVRQGLMDMPCPDQIAKHWEPMHGDFTPWNLRQQHNRTLFLIDWEDAGWAPPGADEVYYRAVGRILGKTAAIPEFGESRAFWIERLHSRHSHAVASGDADADFTSRMADVMAR